MAKKKELIAPKFKSEAEEAGWYDRHRRQLESDMERRIQEGSALTFRQLAGRFKLRPVTIRLATEDIDTARHLASRKGIGYQTYIKLLLREALERESRSR